MPRYPDVLFNKGERIVSIPFVGDVGCDSAIDKLLAVTIKTLLHDSLIMDRCLFGYGRALFNHEGRPRLVTTKHTKSLQLSVPGMTGAAVLPDFGFEAWICIRMTG